MSAVDIIYQKEGSTALLTFPKDENRTGNGWCLFDSEKYLHSDVIFQFQNGRYVNLANTPKYMIFNKERSKWFQLQIKNLTLDDAGTYVCKWSLDGSRYDIELHVLRVYQCQATNRIGNSSSTVNITIQYPPAVELVVSKDFIECILHHGIPASNNLFQLEHQSVFGVHIREIQSFSSDKLLLLKSYIPYETNGIYVCQASNGVVDVDGFAIHNKSTIFKHSGIDYQHVGDVHQQRHDGNFIDSNVSRRNVTDNTSNSTMQLLQTRPTDTHRIDYENMYQPIVRERNDSHCYSQYLPDVLD
ncbi:unnamed protein product [Mytilus coruscus]|uniref:Immunoglobulin V-set domain-containing protein n=1 Tax=Mytilus coruscus TaxID=42192 RepID=A0A6J8AJ72_MYTCO|nr:unnamed protein product [Mytilus coruscus]